MPSHISSRTMTATRSPRLTRVSAVSSRPSAWMRWPNRSTSGRQPRRSCSGSWGLIRTRRRSRAERRLPRSSNTSSASTCNYRCRICLRWGQTTGLRRTPAAPAAGRRVPYIMVHALINSRCLMRRMRKVAPTPHADDGHICIPSSAPPPASCPPEFVSWACRIMQIQRAGGGPRGDRPDEPISPPGPDGAPSSP